jgi:hypothetical protein
MKQQKLTIYVNVNENDEKFMNLSIINKIFLILYFRANLRKQPVFRHVNM